MYLAQAGEALEKSATVTVVRITLGVRMVVM
ncbi:protein of unknown function [Caballeronia sp. S22]